MRIYNIQDAEWEDVRKGVKEYEGKKYIFPGEIPNEKLRENVFALTTNEANYAVPTPTARKELCCVAVIGQTLLLELL